MPTYDYACSECKEEFEVFHSIKEPLRKICPFCEKAGLSVVLNEAPVIINKEIKTIGQLAEKNARELGKYGLQEKMAADGTFERVEKREKREQLHTISKLSPERQRKFIETGKI